MYEILYRISDGKVISWVNAIDPKIPSVAPGPGEAIHMETRDCSILEIEAVTIKEGLICVDPDYKPPPTAAERHQATQNAINACFDYDFSEIDHNELFSVILAHLGFEWPPSTPLGDPEPKV